MAEETRAGSARACDAECGSPRASCKTGRAEYEFYAYSQFWGGAPVGQGSVIFRASGSTGKPGECGSFEHYAVLRCETCGCRCACGIAEDARGQRSGNERVETANRALARRAGEDSVC